MNPKQFAVIVEDGQLIPFNFVTEDFIRDNYKDGTHLILESVDVSSEKARTAAQNNAIHLYCSMLAKALSDSGFDLVGIISQFKHIEITPTKENIKLTVWKTIQNALIGKESTTSLTTKEVSDIYKQVDRFTSSRFNVSIPFPERRE